MCTAVGAGSLGPGEEDKQLLIHSIHVQFVEPLKFGCMRPGNPTQTLSGYIPYYYRSPKENFKASTTKLHGAWTVKFPSETVRDYLIVAFVQSAPCSREMAGTDT